MSKARARDAETVRRWGADILASHGMAQEKRFMQHGDISCYRHSVRVAACSVRLARFLRVRADMRALVRAALLHDYFLYDWHEHDKAHKWHGFHHPAAALRNAQKDFSLSAREQDAIARHMFPITLKPPRFREGWIICLADKWCAAQETLAVRLGRSLRD